MDKLEVVDGRKRQAGYDSIRVRRRKLVEGPADQIKILDAIEDGGTYQKSKVSRQKDFETDELVLSETQRPVST